MIPETPPSRPARLPWAGVRVTTASEARALDEAAIAAGLPSRALMRVAGYAGAAEIAHRHAHRLARGVAVYAGPGNNGGDAWVVAAALSAAGVRVTMRAVGEPKTADAQAERAASRHLELGAPRGGEEIVVDGLLGVGARGAPTGAIAQAIAEVRACRDRGATIVALDIPSGVDADSGEAYGDQSVRAHVTLAFGTLKRGLLVARAQAGAIVVLDIGLALAATSDTTLADARGVKARLPAMPASAHKGSRGKVLIVGGASGMSGAVILAARSALAAGAGLVRVVAHADSLGAVQAAVPQALTTPWPTLDADALALATWADAIVIGPGLGTEGTRERVQQLLGAAPTPTVLDADALNAFAGDAAALGVLLGGRPALVTPHSREFARLSGLDVAAVLGARFDAGRPLARTLGCAVLLKGVPTVITDVDGRVVVSATGTPALATGGSGDVLAGLAGALMAGGRTGADAGACAAWLHGRAAELAQGARSARAISLEDVIVALPSLWDEALPALRVPVLAELPAVRES